MDVFARDLMENMTLSKPSFIFDPDETILGTWPHSQANGCAFMSVKDYDMIVTYLTFLMENEVIDIIFFLISGHDNLIEDVLNNLDILKSKIYVVIPFGETVLDLDLRLNSNLYLYKTHGNGVVLFESYQIR